MYWLIKVEHQHGSYTKKTDFPSDEVETNKYKNDEKEKPFIKYSRFTGQVMNSGSDTNQCNSQDIAEHTAKIVNSKEVDVVKITKKRII